MRSIERANNRECACLRRRVRVRERERKRATSPGAAAAHMPRMSNEQQINVPSLIVILVLSGLIVRYLFFASAPAPQQPRDSAAALRQREAACERIQQMFPQVDRRTVLWNLSRDGNNVAATTERILAGRMETVSFSWPHLILRQYLSLLGHAILFDLC